MQAHLMHNLIHDKGGTCHIAQVFHQRNKEVEDEDVGQKDDDTSHTTDNAVYQQIL